MKTQEELYEAAVAIVKSRANSSGPCCGQGAFGGSGCSHLEARELVEEIRKFEEENFNCLEGNKETILNHLRRQAYRFRDIREQIRTDALHFRLLQRDVINLAKKFGLENHPDIRYYVETTDDEKDIKFIKELKLEGAKFPFFTERGLEEAGITFKDDYRSVMAAFERLIKLVDASADGDY